MRTTRPASPRSRGSRATARHGVDASVAVTRLLADHGDRIRVLALRLCRNRADADDAVQDTFLQAFRKWHTFQGRADAGTWLYAIALRSCRRRRAKERARRTPALSQVMPWRETTVMQIAAAPVMPADDADRREALVAVQTALARLPEHLRVPMILKEVLQLSVADVAGTLGLAPGTVKTRLLRGRLALRKAMTAVAAATAAPPPIFEKQVCLDLLKAKLAAMDRGGARAGFAVPEAEVCARCRAVFRELDLVQDACTQLGHAGMPRALRASIARAIEQRDQHERVLARRGRRPVHAR
jgi:RNA polymerase sigma-70 factor (ECF subfamily)